MSRKRKPDLEGAANPTADPRIAEEARRLLAEEEAGMTETEIRARAEAKRKRLNKERRAQQRKKKSNAADGDGEERIETPAMPAADPRIAENLRRVVEGQQQRIVEDMERHPVLPSLSKNPSGAAEIVLDHYFSADKEIKPVRLLIYYRENWYQYENRRWALVTKDDVESALYKCLLNCRQVDSEGEIHPFVTSQRNVNTIYFQIAKNELIKSGLNVPCIREADGRWREVDGHGLMVCRGEIVDLLTGKSKPNLYTFIPNGADWEYDPDASEPKRWVKFLKQLFGDRADEVAMLQEWFGYVLSGDTWAQKGLIIVGPPRAGKGIIGHVLSHLLGESMVSSPALSALGGTFGLESLVDKRLCLISDARLSSRQDIFAVIEMLLRIIGGDSMAVNRKNKGALNLELGVRVMMLSNEMPQLPDSSDAINKRFMILKLRESFYGREDVKLLDKLTEELPGIALWAMKGYQRVIAAQKFSEPQTSHDARDEWSRDDNALKRFREDCCVVEAGASVTNHALYEAYKEWCEAHGERPASLISLKRKLGVMLGDKIQPDRSNKSVRGTLGLGLNPDRPAWNET